VVELDKNDTSAQDTMNVNSSKVYDEQAAVAMAIENALFNVKS
jgi:hypothetical protein